MFEKQLKKLTMWDIALTKLAVAALVLFRKYVLLLIIYVVTFWPFWTMVYRAIEFSDRQYTPFPPLDWWPFW